MCKSNNNLTVPILKVTLLLLSVGTRFVNNIIITDQKLNTQLLEDFTI